VTGGAVGSGAAVDKVASSRKGGPVNPTRPQRTAARRPCHPAAVTGMSYAKDEARYDA
jgi:hypothetical protein